MEFVMPMLLIRTDIPALIEVNGRLHGEASSKGHVALPLSDTGDYYVCAVPLADGPEGRRYAVTRKVSFRKGKLKEPEAEDVSICAWPGGVYELKLSPGLLPLSENGTFPYSIAHVKWHEGNRERIYTLYYEGGLRLSVEENDRILSGYSLGAGKNGELSLLDVGEARMLIVRTFRDTGERLMAFDFEGELLLDLAGDAAYVEEGCPCAITRYQTQRGHELRRRYDYRNGSFLAQPEETGFFTHPASTPKDDLETAIAFCEAVREGWRDEAWGYLAPDLGKELEFAEVRAFLGEFAACRPPLSDLSGRMLGLIYQKKSRIERAQLFRFEFENGLIANVSEI